MDKRRASFSVFEDLEPKPRQKKKKGEREYHYIFGIRKKRPSGKQRRSQVRGALRKKGLRRGIPKDPIKHLGKVVIRGKKDKTKQEPPYFWGLPSILRRF